MVEAEDEFGKLIHCIFVTRGFGVIYSKTICILTPVTAQGRTGVRNRKKPLPGANGTSIDSKRFVLCAGISTSLSHAPSTDGRCSTLYVRLETAKKLSRESGAGSRESILK
jgi:hypothetical protein